VKHLVKHLRTPHSMPYYGVERPYSPKYFVAHHYTYNNTYHKPSVMQPSTVIPIASLFRYNPVVLSQRISFFTLGLYMTPLCHYTFVPCKGPDYIG